ncbi:hypothetical protein BX600DRAFT_316910 [Xylariales sp. PMI_506]|nr:hypothetical protein BX600DRAFT_316910 [Xylariales sp. PMI_506]
MLRKSETLFDEKREPRSVAAVKKKRNHAETVAVHCLDPHTAATDGGAGLLKLQMKRVRDAPSCSASIWGRPFHPMKRQRSWVRADLWRGLPSGALRRYVALSLALLLVAGTCAALHCLEVRVAVPLKSCISPPRRRRTACLTERGGALRTHGAAHYYAGTATGGRELCGFKAV